MDNNNDNFVGSSYIPIIEYKGKLCIALFRSKNAKVYCDLGGHRENSENSKETCIREVSEESLNTFLINLDGAKKIFYKGYYCYFEKVNIMPKVVEKIYYKNKMILQTKNMPDCWKETDKVDFFPITELMQILNNCDKIHNCKNINGLYKKIWFRPIKFIKYAFISNILTQTNKNIDHLLHLKQIHFTENHNLLNNTTTIIV
jgi:hypothetical protein